jgi:hypothetical protein
MELNRATQEIPKAHWLEFANDVSREYQGWGVTVELLDLELGDQPMAQALPFQGMSFEKEGSEAGNILVEAGDVEPAYATHHIDHPRALRMVASIPGLETDIEIESEDGTTTLVRLRSRPALPPKGSA